jgi:hypothetical protein
MRNVNWRAFMAGTSVLFFASFVGGVAHAGVTTSGCASASSCTLTELYAGGSITGGDVIFDNFFIASGDDFGSISVNADAVSVSIVEALNSVTLQFAFDPALSASGDLDFIGYLFSYSADIVAGATSSIVGAALSALDSQIAIAGDALSGVDIASGSDFMSIYKDGILGASLSDAFASPGVSSLSFDTQLSLLGFETAANASLSGFALQISLRAGTAPEVPLPAALPLFAAGLAGLGFAARRRKTV